MAITAPKPLAADRFERVLAYAALVLLAATLIGRGYAAWDRVPWEVWPHLLTILIALVLTPVILLGRRGDARHRVRMHRRTVRGMATGALLIAGFFTFLPTRLLGSWLFG